MKFFTINDQNVIVKNGFKLSPETSVYNVIKIAIIKKNFSDIFQIEVDFSRASGEKYYLSSLVSNSCTKSSYTGGEWNFIGK